MPAECREVLPERQIPRMGAERQGRKVPRLAFTPFVWRLILVTGLMMVRTTSLPLLQGDPSKGELYHPTADLLGKIEATERVQSRVVVRAL